MFVNIFSPIKFKCGYPINIYNIVKKENSINRITCIWSLPPLIVDTGKDCLTHKSKWETTLVYYFLNNKYSIYKLPCVWISTYWLDTKVNQWIAGDNERLWRLTQAILVGSRLTQEIIVCMLLVPHSNQLILVMVKIRHQQAIKGPGQLEFSDQSRNLAMICHLLWEP